MLNETRRKRWYILRLCHLNPPTPIKGSAKRVAKMHSVNEIIQVTISPMMLYAYDYLPII